MKQKPDPLHKEGIRLQKFLADAGLCSRREAERRIAEGRIRVNGKKIHEMGVRVLPQDRVEMDGEIVTTKEAPVYVLLNKPAGYVSSCRHPNEKPVTDLVRIRERIFPVGRLDKDSTGLLLLTNDGPLHHLLSHPSFDHEKEYRVRTRPSLSGGDLNKMSKGLVIDGKKTRPAEVFQEEENVFRIILKEGRNRQIRKMVATLGAEVKSLHRIRMAFLEIGSLAPGKWRYLTRTEIEGIRLLHKKTGKKQK